MNERTCNFSDDLKESKNPLFLKRMEKLLFEKLEERGFKINKSEFVKKKDSVSESLQIAGVDLILSDSRKFFVEHKKQTYNKQYPASCAIEVLHDFYHKKQLGWTWNLNADILFICRTEGNFIKQSFLLDARKVRKWFVSLLEFNGFNNVYNQDCYDVLLPGKVLQWKSGRTFKIRENRPTLNDNETIRNQSDYFWVIPHNDLKGCFFNEQLNRGQTKLNDFFKMVDNQAKVGDFR